MTIPAGVLIEAGRSFVRVRGPWRRITMHIGLKLPICSRCGALIGPSRASRERHRDRDMALELALSAIGITAKDGVGAEDQP